MAFKWLGEGLRGMGSNQTSLKYFQIFFTLLTPFIPSLYPYPYKYSTMSSDRHIFERFNYNNVFVETGSFQGDGINQAFHAGYRKIVSIELSEYYYNFCKNLYKDQSSFIRLFHGDSGKMLGDIISKIPEPITFWLDGHYSGPIEGGVETALGEKETPLMDELNFIAKHPIKHHTILIDDVGMGKLWDGHSLEKIMTKILSINLSYKFEILSPAGGVPNSILAAFAK